VDRATTEITEEWANIETSLVVHRRASLSVFAGAVWRAGGLSFEEYSDEKRKVGKRTRRLGALYPGRVDLHFSCGVLISSLRPRTLGLASIKSMRIQAQARWLSAARVFRYQENAPHGQRRLGIAFAMPYFRKGAKPQIDKKILAWVDALEDLDTSAYAWVFRKAPGTSTIVTGTSVPGWRS